VIFAVVMALNVVGGGGLRDVQDPKGS